MRGSEILSQLHFHCPLRFLQIFIIAIAFLTLTFYYITFHSCFYFRNNPKVASDSIVVSDVYHSPEVFFLNYAEMEKDFKGFIYPDGDPDTYFQTPRKLTGKYASEGYFFQNIRESRFRTDDPDQAHLFFIPISYHKMRGKVASDSIVVSDVYHSPEVFFLNYAEMEKDFKVFIYPDGDPDTYFQTPRKLTGKYTSEGYFFQNIRESRFRTDDPDQAHLFFIPISCHKMRGKGFLRQKW
ncbi:hypothetical protein U1Q18_031663 [Sarracenia purpurea var. burkii]